MIEDFYKNSNTCEPKGLSSEAVRQYYFSQGFNVAVKNFASDNINIQKLLNEFEVLIKLICLGDEKAFFEALQLIKKLRSANISQQNETKTSKE